MKNLIYPCLWFDGKAEEAADFYCSVFKNSEIRYRNEFLVIFESGGQKFMCINGGSKFTINPSVSFYTLFEDEKELDEAWKSLINGGSVLMPLDRYDWNPMYGWLQDCYGVSWQLALGRMEDVDQKFTPVLMFTGKQNGRAEESMGFYTSVFKDSGVKGILRYAKGENEPEESVKHAQFQLGNQVFMAMDSSLQHQFGFNEAVSLVVNCENQEEIDYYWNKLTEGGEESRSGWLKDKFGVSWQIIPAILFKLMSDASKSERVVNAFLQMKKFDIEKLVNA